MISSAEQVRQRARHVQSMQLLRQTSVANFVEAENALDYEEAVFDLRAHLRLGAITAALLIAQRVTGCSLLLREVWPGVLADHFALVAIPSLPHSYRYAMV
jgi:hypothetical protein